jgi:DNA-binding IclR family transcriptional regulator
MPAAASLGLAIVQTLKLYHRALPLDFLARRTRRSSSDVGRYVEELERMGVVVRQGDSVALAN